MSTFCFVSFRFALRVAVTWGGTTHLAACPDFVDSPCSCSRRVLARGHRRRRRRRRHVDVDIDVDVDLDLDHDVDVFFDVYVDVDVTTGMLNPGKLLRLPPSASTPTIEAVF